MEYSRPSTQAPLANGNGARHQSTYLSDPGNGGMPRIPRAQTNMEMSPSNREPYYSEIQPKNSPYAQRPQQGNLYAESRPQSNPYAESRPQGNPYASRQGVSNPYFMNDDGRRPNYWAVIESWSKLYESFFSSDFLS